MKQSVSKVCSCMSRQDDFVAAFLYDLALIAVICNWIFMKKIVYVDMDNVLVDFQSASPKLPKKILDEYKNNEDGIPGISPLWNRCQVQSTPSSN